MPSPSRFQPDNLYCVYCHAIASGPCATCKALICVDCCTITGGSVKKVAVCKRCHEKGHGAVGWRKWWTVLGPLLIFLAIALGMVLILSKT